METLSSEYDNSSYSCDKNSLYGLGCIFSASHFECGLVPLLLSLCIIVIPHPQLKLERVYS